MEAEGRNDAPGLNCRESLGIFWDFSGNFLGIFWESLGSFPSISQNLPASPSLPFRGFHPRLLTFNP